VTSRNGDDAPSTFVRAVSDEGQEQGNLRKLAPAITILWHYDLNRVGKTAPLGPTRTEVSRNTEPFDLVIDYPLSRAPFLFVDHEDGSVIIRPGAIKTTVFIDDVPLTGPHDIDAKRLKRGVILKLGHHIVVCLHQVRTPVLRGPDLGFVGNSDVMEDVRGQIRRVADLDFPVLIRGQSGTGKELVARAIAAASSAPTPFLAVDMGALTTPVMAADALFGHEKGAYTGATADRAGYFVQADGGTLFLDEILATPLDVQPMILRVLQDGQVPTLGSGKHRHVRVRLLTATDKDLEAAVAAGTFHLPLFTRIRGYTIDLPALADRREDIGSLFLHFLKLKLKDTGELHQLAARNKDERSWLGALDFVRIARAAYPGNLRDLESLATEIAVDSRGKAHAVFGPRAESILAQGPLAPPPKTSVRMSRRAGQPTDEQIAEALLRHGNNGTAAAKELGISRTTLYARGELNPSLLRPVDELSDDEVVTAYSRHQGNVDRMAVDLRVSPKALKPRLAAALKRQG
jgi:two-component system nitrogen regulation response regulator GlnG